MLNEEQKKTVISRLKRIQGQIRSLQKMIETEVMVVPSKFRKTR